MPGMSQISGSSPAFKRLEPVRTSEAFADFNALILLLTGAPHHNLGETLSGLGRDNTSGRIEGDPKKDRSEKADLTNQNVTPPLQVELAQPLPIQLARGQLTIAAAAGSGPGTLVKRESQSGPGVAPDTSLTGPAAPSPPAFTVAGHPSPPSIPTRTGDVPPNGIRGGTAGLAPLAFAAELTEIYPSMGPAAAVAKPLDPTAVGQGLTESPDGLTIAEPVFGSNQILAAPLSTLAASISVPLQRSPKAIGERTLVKSPPSYLDAPGFDLESGLSKTSDARTPPKGQATGVNAMNPIPQDESRGASGQASPNKEKSASTPLSIQSGNIPARENGANFSHSLSEMVAEKPPSGRADAPGTHDSPKLESKSEINPNLRPPPAREISLRLPGSGESGSVDLRISERAGKVQIAVRTLDAGLARALRSDISDLVGRLERKGFDTQTWLPPERSGHGTVETQNGSTSEHGGSRQSGNGWQTAADPQQQRQRNRPRWLDEMEAKNSDQDGSSNEGEEE